MYDAFSRYYDDLTGDVDYKKRTAYLMKLFKKYGKAPKLLLDVACGTGGFSNEFARLGVEVIGTDISEEMLKVELIRRKMTILPASELFTGILHNRLGRVLTQSVGIKGMWKIADLNEDEINAVCAVVKGLEVNLTEPMGMDAAQVTAGGIVTGEFDPQTMESKLVPGLYACGEVLDIDGDCGGYNLQWAWSSGHLAGMSAGGNT